jgi:hypothetical protein
MNFVTYRAMSTGLPNFCHDGYWLATPSGAPVPPIVFLWIFTLSLFNFLCNLFFHVLYFQVYQPSWHTTSLRFTGAWLLTTAPPLFAAQRMACVTLALFFLHYRFPFLSITVSVLLAFL